MICRRCGMDSSTTDSCEWCKKPMLPPGGAISAKAKEELLRSKEEAAKQPQEIQSAAPERQETEEEAAIRRPESKPPPPPPAVHASGLLALGADLGAGDPEPEGQIVNYLAGEETQNLEILRPLGSLVTRPKQEEAKDTPIYIGSDENVLRPITRPVSKDGTKYMIDATGRKRRVVDNTPDIPDKVRLFRATVRGVPICMLIAIIQFVMQKRMPDHFTVLPVSGYDTFLGAIIYGLFASLLYGFMLSAVLVQRKWGAAAGFFIGTFLLGWMAMLNSSNLPWSMITGALCGIFCGLAAGKGVKRIIAV